MRHPRRVRIAFVAFGLAACGAAVHVESTPLEEDDPSAMSSTPPPAAGKGSIDVRPSPPMPQAPPGSGTRTMSVSRASLTAVLDAGPGAFLHGFEVAPVMEGDKFAGWRLVQMMPGEHRFDGLDLVPGDVLLAVNGQPVSKPDQLAALWDSLRTASQIVVDLARGEGRFQLRVSVTPAAVMPAAAPAR